MSEKPSNNLFLSVVLTFFNEQDILPVLVDRLRKTMRGLIEKEKIGKYEMIL